VPDQLGIAVFSPPLDERGNSVRGVRVCEAISQEFGLHLFDSSRGCHHFLDHLGKDHLGKDHLDKTEPLISLSKENS